MWFRHTVLSRTGKINNSYRSFPSFRELSRSDDRVDFISVSRSPLISLDYDFKRMPLKESMTVDFVDDFEIAGFKTVAWDSVEDYTRARQIARHLANERPGTHGKDRPTGCLRTEDDWSHWFRRFHSGKHRRIRTAGSAFLTELVAGHKAKIWNLPVLSSKISIEEKLVWLRSLGYGDFTRSQWDHMGKKARREKVLADINYADCLAEVEALIADS